MTGHCSTPFAQRKDADPARDRRQFLQGEGATPCRFLVGGQPRDTSGRFGIVSFVAVTTGGIVAVIGVVTVITAGGIAAVCVTFVSGITFIAGVTFIASVTFVPGFTVVTIIRLGGLDTQYVIDGFHDILVDFLVGKLAQKIDRLFAGHPIIGHRRRVGAKQSGHGMRGGIGLCGFGGMGGIQIAKRTCDAAAALAAARSGLTIRFPVVAVQRGRGCDTAATVSVTGIDAAVTRGGAAVAWIDAAMTGSRATVARRGNTRGVGRTATAGAVTAAAASSTGAAASAGATTTRAAATTSAAATAAAGATPAAASAATTAGATTGAVTTRAAAARTALGGRLVEAKVNGT